MTLESRWLPVCVVAVGLLPVVGGDARTSATASRIPFGIGELLNGRLIAVDLDGHVEEVNLPQNLFFRVSNVSQDGSRIAGYSDVGFAVVTRSMKQVWGRSDLGRNVISLALSPDGTRILIATAEAGTSRWTGSLWKLSVIEESGGERALGNFSYNRPTDGLVTLTWDPASRRAAFNDKGEIRILDTETADSKVVGSGLDPTWSPNGLWIAYRTPEAQIALLDPQTGHTKVGRLGVKVISFAHWSPNSKYIFVDEDEGRPHGCVSNSRLVVYEVASAKHHKVYDPCGRRDWSFGWITQPELWISAARAAESMSRNSQE